MRTYPLIILSVFVLLLSGCQAPKIRLFPSHEDPLEEFTLEGKQKGKVLVIPVRGVISDMPEERLIRTKPSMVQEFVSQLRKAEKDEEIKAVLLKIDTPGGSVTASDVLYHELMAFKKKTGAKVVVVMMDVAASGGYYISLPADYILAHPTTVTGSIGVLFLRPNVMGLMDKIGVELEVNKTGRNKDMGSPFRKATQEEEKLIQEMADAMAKRFLDRVAKHRKIAPESLSNISTARIYLADDALKLGLVDQVGYVNDGLSQAKKLASLPENAKIVVYRRTEYPDDNIYNTALTQYGGRDLSLVSFKLPGSLGVLEPGFYYLWPTAVVK